MTIGIKTPVTKEKVQGAIEQLSKEPEKKIYENISESSKGISMGLITKSR